MQPFFCPQPSDLSFTPPLVYSLICFSRRSTHTRPVSLCSHNACAWSLHSYFSFLYLSCIQYMFSKRLKWYLIKLYIPLVGRREEKKYKNKQTRKTVCIGKDTVYYAQEECYACKIMCFSYMSERKLIVLLPLGVTKPAKSYCNNLRLTGKYLRVKAHKPGYGIWKINHNNVFF